MKQELPPLLVDLWRFVKAPVLAQEIKPALGRRVLRILRIIGLQFIVVLPLAILISVVVVGTSRSQFRPTPMPPAQATPSPNVAQPDSSSSPEDATEDTSEDAAEDTSEDTNSEGDIFAQEPKDAAKDTRSIGDIFAQENAVSKMLASQNAILVLIMAALVAPVLEETAFRLGLKPSAWRIGLSLGMSTVMAAPFVVNAVTRNDLIDITKGWLNQWRDAPSWLYDYSKYIPAACIIIVALLVGVMVFLIARTIGSQRLHALYERRSRWIFYFSAIAFGLMHLQNYPNRTLWLAAPILVMPQIIMGLGLGYARIRFGFVFSILMHCLYNSALFLPASAFATFGQTRTQTAASLIGVAFATAFCGITGLLIAINTIYSLVELRNRTSPAQTGPAPALESPPPQT